MNAASLGIHSKERRHHLRRTSRKTKAFKFRYRRHGLFVLAWIGIVLPVLVHAEHTKDRRSSSDRLEEIVRSLCARLQIKDDVTVRVDERNDKMVSSEPIAGQAHSYRISFDREFLEMLDEDEIQAAIAHELGHVWIFSHHPFLQTEELANEIAMRVTPRNLLEKVYIKLWSHNGITGSLDELLGPDRSRGATLLP